MKDTIRQNEIAWIKENNTADDLFAASKAFIDKVDEISPFIDSLTTFAFIHGVPYTGPSWENEYNELVRVLKNLEKKHEQ